MEEIEKMKTPTSKRILQRGGEVSHSTVQESVKVKVKQSERAPLRVILQHTVTLFVWLEEVPQTTCAAKLNFGVSGFY